MEEYRFTTVEAGQKLPNTNADAKTLAAYSS